MVYQRSFKVGGIVSECINEGRVVVAANSSEGPGAYSAGISGGCGYNSLGTITSCINLGDIEATANVLEARLGGIVGIGSKAGSTVIVENSYNAGQIIGGWIRSGVLAYEMPTGYGTHVIQNNYWVVEKGADYGRAMISSNVGTTPTTETALKEQDAETINLGDAYSKKQSNINKGYPVLKWQLGEN